MPFHPIWVRHMFFFFFLLLGKPFLSFLFLSFHNASLYWCLMHSTESCLLVYAFASVRRFDYYFVSSFFTLDCKRYFVLYANNFRNATRIMQKLLQRRSAVAVYCCILYRRNVEILLVMPIKHCNHINFVWKKKGNEKKKITIKSN